MKILGPTVSVSISLEPIEMRKSIVQRLNFSRTLTTRQVQLPLRMGNEEWKLFTREMGGSSD